MKLLVDVKRAEQLFDFDKGTQQNFLVLEFGGAEFKVPCTEDQVIAAVRQVTREADEPEDHAAAEGSTFHYEPEAEERPVEGAGLFVAPAVEPPVMKFVEPASVPMPQARITLQPISRPRSDDASIPQG